jgi:hypothetical protein
VLWGDDEIEGRPLGYELGFSVDVGLVLGWVSHPTTQVRAAHRLKSRARSRVGGLRSHHHHQVSLREIRPRLGLLIASPQG